MALMSWWFGILVALLLPVVWLIVDKKILGQNKTTKHPRKKPVANTYRLLELPAYQLAIRRYRRVLYILLSAILVLAILAILLSARPATFTSINPENRSRDIVLCLDVSGSMMETDAKILETYRQMTKQFNGERISLVIFDSSPATVFPLTDDYDYVDEEMSKAIKSLDPNYRGSNYDYSILGGVNEGQGSSLIGDGLASCVNRFDKLGDKRSRSIILGTDNYLAGSPIVTLMESAVLARDKKIRVYGINPNDYSSDNYIYGEAEEFKKAMLLTDGDYYKLDDVSSTQKIINKIVSQEATRTKGSPMLVLVDTPKYFLLVMTGLTVAYIVAVWRFKL